MRPRLDEPRKLAPLLWGLFAVFVLRVVGQALVAFSSVDFLPPMQAWYSGLVSYAVLLPAQIVIIVLMLKVCIDFTRGAGLFVRPHRFFAVHWLIFGYLYLAVMVLRYPIQMFMHPESRWFGGTIPIVVHWALAAFVILVGFHHRRRLAP